MYRLLIFWLFFQGLRPYSGLHRAYLCSISIKYKWGYTYSFFLPNFLGAMFIQRGMFIPDSRVTYQKWTLTLFQNYRHVFSLCAFNASYNNPITSGWLLQSASWQLRIEHGVLPKCKVMPRQNMNGQAVAVKISPVSLPTFAEYHIQASLSHTLRMHPPTPNFFLTF